MSLFAHTNFLGRSNLVRRSLQAGWVATARRVESRVNLKSGPLSPDSPTHPAYSCPSTLYIMGTRAGTPSSVGPIQRWTVR
jgi:hypothetical protein